MKPFIPTTIGMLGLFLAIGCGGSSQAPVAQATTSNDPYQPPAPSVPVRKTGSGEVTASVGPAGGVLELNEGPRVEIPPGAVQDEMDFVLKVTPGTTAFLNLENEKALGPTFVLSPSVGAPDGADIVVSYPLSSYPDGWGEGAMAYEYPVGDRAYAEDSVHTKWQYEPGRLEGGRVLVRVPALNGMRLQFTITNQSVQ